MAEETAAHDQFEAFPQLHETPEELAYELRAQEGSLWTGGRLLIGVVAFAFAALAFAYFYLRSANNFDLWRPKGITAPTGAGAAIWALTVAAGLLAIFGTRRFRKDQVLDWQVAGWTAVLGALIVVGLQIWQLSELPFFPGSSGYASTFVAWAPMNIVLVLGAAYWTETLLAREMRMRRAVLEDGGAPNSKLPTARLFRTNLDGSTFFWGFTIVVATFFWVLFYVL